MFDVTVCGIELVFIEEQLHQGEMDPKLFTMPVERGRDPEGCLEVVDCLLCLALVAIYIAKEIVRLADLELIAFFQKRLIARDAASSAASSCLSECNSRARRYQDSACPNLSLRHSSNSNASLACPIPSSKRPNHWFASDRNLSVSATLKLSPALAEVSICEEGVVCALCDFQ